MAEPNSSTEFRDLGNTNSKSRQPSPKINWFFTWNNYPDDWENYFSSNSYFDKYAMQEETGENGTKHIQGCIHLDKKRRWTEFKLPKEIHWEACKSWEDSVEYCTKQETRTGKRALKGVTVKRKLKLIDPTYPWEQEILRIIEEEPDDRKIYWYWSTEGCKGKTQFAKYLSVKHNSIPLDGRKNDILYCAGTYESDIYTYILSRDQEDYVSYDALEKVKDGYYMCAKYESKPIIRPPPHVFVFANFAPVLPKMSEDRWVVRHLD